MNNDELLKYYETNVPLLNPEFEFMRIKEFRNNINRHVITIHHKLCGRDINIIYGNYLYRRHCKYCNFSRYDIRNFIEKFNSTRSDSNEYNILSYNGLYKPLSVKHIKCGKTFSMRADTLLYLNGTCPCVNNQYTNKKNTTFDVLDKRIQETDNEYRLYEINSEPVKILTDHIKIIHISCGTIFTCIPHNFFSQNHFRCPNCKVYPKNLIGHKDSNGVKIIESWIKSKGLLYEKEKRFDNLKSPISGRKLRYDFYIPDLNLIIEFDGKQHYDTHTTSVFTKEKYDRIRVYDKIKNKYCEKHNIYLIRIKYVDSSQEFIYKKLDKFFNKTVRIYYIKNYDKIE